MAQPAPHAPVLPLSFRADVHLSRHLLRLHRAMTIEEFWKGLHGLLAAALPSHSISVYLNYFNIGRDFRALHHQITPGHHEPWEERRKVSPTPAFLRAHVGKKIFGLHELIPDERNVSRTDYFKKVMSVEGWHSLLCLTYWKQKNPLAMVVVRRGQNQAVFAPQEIELLESLYDHFDTALDRIRRMHDEQAGLACLAQCLPFFPLGLMALNESLTPVFKNREALEACLCWNHGADAARRYDPAKAFVVPPIVEEACRELARRWAMRDECADEQHLLRPIYLTHPKQTEWKFSVGLIRPKDYCLAQPYFLVQCTNRHRDASSTLYLSPYGLMKLQELTPAEQLVAMAAAEGLSNAEVALKLNKTFVTVRAQLHSVFSKLNIRRRSQLASLLK